MRTRKFLLYTKILCLTRAKVCNQDQDITSKEFILAHGKSSFLKPEKVQKLQREHTGTGRAGVCKLVPPKAA